MRAVESDTFSYDFRCDFAWVDFTDHFADVQTAALESLRGGLKGDQDAANQLAAVFDFVHYNSGESFRVFQDKVEDIISKIVWQSSFIKDLQEVT